MSFYSSLFLYHPGPPPKISGRALAGFLREFAALGRADDSGIFQYGLTFGPAIDQDPREAAHDVEAADFATLADLIDDLAGQPDEPISRAFLSLGQMAPDLIERLRREPSEENETSLVLDSWSMEIGPIESFDLGREEPFPVGWVEVAMSGYGYLYPWSLRDLVRRAEAIPQIPRLVDLLRRTWPAPPEPPSMAVVDRRKAMGPLWPYSEAGRPLDWHWGLTEG